MKKLIGICLGLVGTGLALAKIILNDRTSETRDEIDLAVVMASKRLRIRAAPFLGGTVMVIAGQVEIDLRRAMPAPTGVEVTVMLIASSLRVVAIPQWHIETRLASRGTRVTHDVGSMGEDAAVLRVTGSAWLSRVRVEARSAPTAVAS